MTTDQVKHESHENGGPRVRDWADVALAAANWIRAAAVRFDSDDPLDAAVIEGGLRLADQLSEIAQPPR